MDKKALILVVDDNAEYRELLVWCLETSRFPDDFGQVRS